MTDNFARLAAATIPCPVCSGSGWQDTGRKNELECLDCRGLGTEALIPGLRTAVHAKSSECFSDCSGYTVRDSWGGLGVLLGWIVRDRRLQVRLHNLYDGRWLATVVGIAHGDDRFGEAERDGAPEALATALVRALALQEEADHAQ